MVPCCGPGCEYCAAAVGAQVRYAMAVAEVYSRRVGLLEVGRANGLHIQDLSLRRGSLRGMMLRLTKHSKSNQSRTDVVQLDIEAPLWASRAEPPDPALALYLTWHKAGFAMPPEFSERMSLVLRSGRGPGG